MRLLHLIISMAQDAIHQYPKGDFRRMLSVLAAIDTLQNPTLVRISERTGIDKKSVSRLILQAGEQAGVVISKTGPSYRVDDWGVVIKRSGAKLVLHGVLISQSVEVVG